MALSSYSCLSFVKHANLLFSTINGSLHGIYAQTTQSLALSSLCCVQDCEPLWLTGTDGVRFRFIGAAAVAGGTVEAAAALRPPDAAAGAKYAVHCCGVRQGCRQVGNTSQITKMARSMFPECRCCKLCQPQYAEKCQPNLCRDEPYHHSASLLDYGLAEACNWHVEPNSPGTGWQAV